MPGSITIVGGPCHVCGSSKAACGCTERTVTAEGFTSRYLFCRAVDDLQALVMITPHIRRRDPIRIEEPPRSPRPRRRKGRP